MSCVAQNGHTIRWWTPERSSRWASCSIWAKWTWRWPRNLIGSWTTSRSVVVAAPLSVDVTLSGFFFFLYFRLPPTNVCDFCLIFFSLGSSFVLFPYAAVFLWVFSSFFVNVLCLIVCSSGRCHLYCFFHSAKPLNGRVSISTISTIVIDM